jgi:hypothetical protein
MAKKKACGKCIPIGEKVARLARILLMDHEIADCLSLDIVTLDESPYRKIVNDNRRHAWMELRAKTFKLVNDGLS